MIVVIFCHTLGNTKFLELADAHHFATLLPAQDLAQNLREKNLLATAL